MTSGPVRARLAPLIQSGAIATCSIVDLEVLYSARDHEEHERIRVRRLLAYEQIPLTQQIFDRAVEVQGALARTGQHRLPIPDLIVAAAAESADRIVLHYDADFDRIAAVTGQACERIVPAGSAD
jgi:predicted nucleic acid-binding protein